MNTHDPISTNPTKRIGIAHVALGLAAAWFCVHAAIYLIEMFRLDPVLHKHLEHAVKHFFGWQAGGFLIAAIVVHTRRPSATGRVLGGYLVVSTGVLLALSRDAAMLATLAVLLLWTACAAQGMRLAIARAVGERYATWGVATASVYAALVPICFFMGVLHVITPPVVTALAVVTALPGAVLWLRPLRNIAPRSHAPRGNGSGATLCVSGFPTQRRGASEDAGSHAERGKQKNSLLTWFLLEAIWAILAVEFIGASTPEVLSDSIRVHVPYMLRVIADHGISHQYACWHRLQPMAVQTYGATIAAVGTIAAAKWFSWLALATLAMLVGEEVRRRSGSRELGLFAAAAAISCPLLARLSNTLYIDHVMTMLCTAGCVVLFRALRPPCLRGILLSAAIMGSMTQVKYTGLIFSAVWGVFLAVDLLRRCGRRLALRWSAAAGVLLALTTMPWYVYVYLGTGNPFYPYLNSWFHSPYWAEGVTLQKIFEVNFKLTGAGDTAAFPWTATYFTHRFVEGYDGTLSFWALALAPCWFLALLVRRKGDSPHLPERPGGCFAQMGTVPFSPRGAASPNWDMVIVGVAMIVGVVTYTPYVRYWMPAYPLLVASCVLAAGCLIRSIQWRPEGRLRALLAGTALAFLLFVPAPLLCVNLPWDAYSKRISKEEYLTQKFQEYPAIKQLNTILKPSDGVACTGCNAIYLVKGRPYELAIWWNDIHHIKDRASFDAYCQRNGIHYWMVNHISMHSLRYSGRDDIVKKYWTDDRLVAASGTMVVYDVSPRAPRAFEAKKHREWRIAIEKPDSTWSPAVPKDNWVNLAQDVAATPAASAIAVNPGAWIGHRISVEGKPGLYRIDMAIWSEALIDPLLDVTWYDANDKLISRTNGAASGRHDQNLWIYSLAPQGAKYGWVYVREWQRKPFRMTHAAVSFWEKSKSTAVAGRNSATNAGKEVR